MPWQLVTQPKSLHDWHSNVTTEGGLKKSRFYSHTRNGELFQ
jgi:hypothetical protein